MPADPHDRGTRTYLLAASALVLVYGVSAAILQAGKDFPDRGPLSPPGSTPRQDPALEQVLAGCHGVNIGADVFKQVVTADVDGRRLHACYPARPTPGGYSDVVVIDGEGRHVDHPAVLKAAGAWPWRGVVVRGAHLVYGVVALAAVCLLGLLLYRHRFPGPRSGPVGGTRPRRSWGRRARIAGRLALIGFILTARTLLFDAVRVEDLWGVVTTAFLAAGFFLATVGAWFWLMRPDFDRPDELQTAVPHYPNRAAAEPVANPSRSRREVDAAAALRQFRAEAGTRAAASKVLRAAVIFVTATIGAVALWITVHLTFVQGGGALVAVVGVLATLVGWAVLVQLVGTGTAVVALPLILGWRRPARILLLRPFNRVDRSRPLRGLARREAAVTDTSTPWPTWPSRSAGTWPFPCCSASWD